jgi:aromatic-L-amino-acid decarboxylase
VPPYLETDVGEQAVDLMDYGIQLGRRFRAIKLWWVLRSFGAEGIRRRIREHCAMARELADRIDADPRFSRVAPVPFSTLCFRGVWDGLSPEQSDRANEQLAARVSSHGPVFLAHTRLRGRVAIRFAIGNIRTDRTRIDTAWALLEREHARIESEA